MSIQIIKTPYGIARKWCCDHCDFTRLEKAEDGDVPGTTLTSAFSCEACGAAESGKLTPPAPAAPPVQAQGPLARLVAKQDQAPTVQEAPKFPDYMTMLHELIDAVDPSLFNEPDDSHSLQREAITTVKRLHHRIINAEERCVRLGEENERLNRELFDTQLRTSIQEAERDGAVKELTMLTEWATHARETLNNIAHVVNIGRPLDLNAPVDHRILVDAVKRRETSLNRQLMTPSKETLDKALKLACKFDWDLGKPYLESALVTIGELLTRKRQLAVEVDELREANKSLMGRIEKEQDLGALARGALASIAEIFEVRDSLNFTVGAHVDCLVRKIQDKIRDKANELKLLKSENAKQIKEHCSQIPPELLDRAQIMGERRQWERRGYYMASALDEIEALDKEISNLRSGQIPPELLDRAQAMGADRKWPAGRFYLASALDEIEALDKKLEAMKAMDDMKNMGDMEVLKHSNRALKSEMEGITRQRNGAYERIEALETELAAIRKTLEAAQNEVRNKAQEIHIANTKICVLNRRLEDIRIAVGNVAAETKCVPSESEVSLMADWAITLANEIVEVACGRMMQESVLRSAQHVLKTFKKGTR